LNIFSHDCDKLGFEGDFPCSEEVIAGLVGFGAFRDEDDAVGGLECPSDLDDCGLGLDVDGGDGAIELGGPEDGYDGVEGTGLADDLGCDVLPVFHGRAFRKKALQILAMEPEILAKNLKNGFARRRPRDFDPHTATKLFGR